MVLFDCLSTAQAWRMLHDGQTVRTMDTEAYYDLCVAAGYSEEASQKAASDWAMQRLRADKPV